MFAVLNKLNTGIFTQILKLDKRKCIEFGFCFTVILEKSESFFYISLISFSSCKNYRLACERFIAIFCKNVNNEPLPNNCE